MVQSDRRGQGSEAGHGSPTRARHGRMVLQSHKRTRGKKSLIEKAIGRAELILLTWTCLTKSSLVSASEGLREPAASQSIRCCCQQRACGMHRRSTIESDLVSHPWTSLSSPTSGTMSHHSLAARFAWASLIARGHDERTNERTWRGMLTGGRSG